MAAAKPLAIHLRMIEALRSHPDGLTEAELRQALNLATNEQGQFGRRRRDLKKWFIIDRIGVGLNTRYVYRGDKLEPYDDKININRRLRAKILSEAHGRCGMCGRTIEKHGISLDCDHKIPRDWGGKTIKENLWALCEDCNQGKKAHFATQDQNLMRQVMGHESVHVRLGELLKLHFGKPVSASLISLVAGPDNEDWKKRVRELRYLGWDIKTSRKREPSGKVQSYYTLLHHTAWPENPSAWLQKYERDRAAANRARRASSGEGQ